MRRKSQMGRSLLGFCLLACLWFGMPRPAIASVHEYPEGTGKVMVRSLQTLRDRRDQSWQLVLFKRMSTGQLESLHLRLVGFPGGAEFQHPANLLVSGSDRGWSARDVLPSNSEFPTTVGEYDVLDLMTHLTSNAPLEMILPLSPQNAELVIPPFVIKEWRQLVEIKPSGS